MKLKIKGYGKFDLIGEQKLFETVIEIPKEKDAPFKIKVLGKTLKGRIRVEEVG